MRFRTRLTETLSLRFHLIPSETKVKYTLRETTFVLFADSTELGMRNTE